MAPADRMNLAAHPGDLLLPSLRIGDADRSPTVDQNALGVGFSENLQVAPALGGAQVPTAVEHRRPVARRELEIADAVLLCAVEVVAARDADLLRRSR